MAETSTPQIPKTPSDFSFGSDLHSSYQFLIDSRNYIANHPIPDGENYYQTIHGDNKTIGNPNKPAMLNASYQMLNFESPSSNRHLLSISLPDFTDMQAECDDWSAKDPKRNTGFNMMNLSESLSNILKSHGIEIKKAKGGYHTPAGTAYLEYDLKNPADFEKGKQIIDAIVHSKASTAEQLEAEISKISPRVEPIKTVIEENVKSSPTQTKSPIPRATSFAGGALGVTALYPASKDIGNNLKDGHYTEDASGTAAVVAGGACFSEAATAATPLLAVEPFGAAAYLAVISAAGYSCGKIAGDAVHVVGEQVGNFKPSPPPTVKTPQNTNHSR